MVDLLITDSCTRCGGSGNEPGGDAPGGAGVCQACGGDGIVTVAVVEDVDTILTDVMDKLNDVMDKLNDILDKCNDILQQVSGS